MVRFIHAADIHLDSSEPRGLVPYEGAPVEACRHATRRALENLVTLAIDESVDLLLIAGDVYDGDWKDARTGLFFINQLRKLREANIRCYMIRGNHDAASEISLHLPMPSNRDGSPMLFSHARCQTVHLDDVGVSLHGHSFATRAVRENLAVGYPQPISGHQNIAMLHTCLEGAEGHETYAPCTTAELTARGYDYWALGHIHQRLAPPPPGRGPPILFSGNLQGRHIRECGAKGVYLVTMEQGPPKIEFRSVDCYRWEQIAVDLTDACDEDELFSRFALAVQQTTNQHPDRPIAVRCELRGRTALHQRLFDRLPVLTEQLRSVGVTTGGGRVWLEEVRIRTQSPRASGSRSADSGSLEEGPLGELLQFVDQLRDQSDELRALAAPIVDLARRLPAGISESAQLKPDDPEWLNQLLMEVSPLLASRLTEARIDHS